MTWQDELQQLDADLAAGKISAEEYRSRRDALAGRAPNGPEGGAGQPGTPSGGVPQQGQQPNPFPPAFSWGAAAQAAQQAQQHQQPQPSEDSTQVVPGPVAGGPAPAPQQQWPDQQQWNQGWGGGWSNEQPPPAEHGDTSWMRQGPEVFEVGESSGRGKLIAGLSIGAVLLVVVVVAGVFFLSTSGQDSADGKGGSTPSAAPPPPAPTSDPLPEPPAPKAPPAAPQDVLVAAPAGPPHPYNGLLDRAGLEGPKSGVLRDPVRNAALQGGMTDGWINRTDGPPSVSLIAVRMPDDQAASAVVQAYLNDQQGLKADEDLSYQGVQVVTTGGGVFRTAYAAHGWAIVVETSAADKVTAENAFKQLLSSQLAQTPPTVRE